MAPDPTESKSGVARATSSVCFTAILKVNTLEGGLKQTRIEGKKTALGLYRFAPVDPFAECKQTACEIIVQAPI